jgi:nucleoside-diphosphate-sugar epimerase
MPQRGDLDEESGALVTSGEVLAVHAAASRGGSMKALPPNQTVLITGASGFIGSHLTHTIVAGSPDVRIRLLARASSNLTAFESLPNIDVVRVSSWHDVATVREAFHGIDYAFNTAGAVVDWGKYEDFADANITMVQCLVEAAVAEQQRPDSHLKRFLHISTADVYGYPGNEPSEDVPPREIGIPYIATKIIGERIVLAEKERLAVTVFRPASVYGARSKDFVLEIATLLKSRLMVLAMGHVDAGLIYIDDAVDALITAAQSAPAVGEIYNLCGGAPVTWDAYVNRLADALGYPRPRIALPFGLLYALGYVLETVYGWCRWYAARPLLTRHAVYVMGRSQSVPIDKAKRDFAFEPRVDVTSGVQQCAAWLKTLPQFRGR